MKKSPDQISREWLFFAQSDLRLANLAFRDKIYHEACFLSQQAAEKSLKAILARKSSAIPKIHSLHQLHKLVIRDAEIKGVPPDKIRFLDQFYLLSRYPDAFPGSLPEGLPNKNDAAKAIEFAENFFQLAKRLLKK